MNVCFVVPDGTGIRNYLFSDVIQELHAQGAKIWIWHTLTDDAVNEIRKIHPEVHIEASKLPKYKEGVYEKFLREAVSYARLITNTSKMNNETIMVNWRKNPKRLSLKLFYYLAKQYGKVLARDYKRILKADKQYLRRVESSKQLASFEKFLRDIEADCLLCTHQRAITAIPAMHAANKNRIRTISAIYSWDNMPKARLNTRSKHYIVWSEYMKEEMKTYYPEIDAQSIVITGTPQFEFYYDQTHIISKEAFCKEYQLDINKKTICYSGDDRLTSPYDPDYLAELAQMIRDTDLKEKVQILLRRAPVDLSGRFDTVVQEYADIIKVADPVWHFDGDDKHNWTLVYPSMEDVSLLINTAYHCDLVYNVGSTMAHDFALFDKPAAYINYDVEHADNWSTNIIYQYQHFRSQSDLDPVIWINDKEELYRKVYDALYTELPGSLDNGKWLERIAPYRQSASKKIADLMMGV